MMASVLLISLGVYLSIGILVGTAYVQYERGLGTSLPKSIGIGVVFGAFWPAWFVAAIG